MMTKNQVLVDFKGDNSDLKKKAKEAKDDLDGVKKSSDKVDESIKKTGNSYAAAGQKMSSIGSKMSIGLTLPLLAVGAAAVSSLNRIEQLNSTTTAALKATGNAANVTLKDIEKLSGAIEKQTGIEAEAVQTGQNMLLTFKNIRNESGKGNDIFDQTTVALTDMATFMNKGVAPSAEQMSAQAIQLGKALNDPIKGIAALGRAGVQFTQQQKDQITAMVENGDVMGAQKVILAELNSQFGGAGAAFGETNAGKIAKMKHEFGTVTEELALRLIPAMTNVVNAVSGLFLAYQNLSKGQQTAIFGVIAFLAVLGPLITVIGRLIMAGKAIVATGKFIGLATIKVYGYAKAVAHATVMLVKNGMAASKTAVLAVASATRSGVAWVAQGVRAGATWVAQMARIGLATTKSGVLAVAAATKSGLAWVGAALKSGVAWTKTFLIYSLGVAKAALTTSIAAIKMAASWLIALGPIGLIVAAVALAVALIIANWDTVKAAAQAVWEWIKNAVGTVIDWIVAYFNFMVLVWTTILTAIKDTAVTIWNTIQTTITGVVDKVKEVWNGIVDWFKGIFDKIVLGATTIKDAIAGAFTGAIDLAKSAFKAGINWIIDKINTLIKGANKVAGVLGKIPGVPDISVSEIAKVASGGYIGYADGGPVRGGGSGTSDSIPAMLSNGEFVLNAAAVRSLGVANLNMMNETGQTQRDAPVVGQIIMNENADPMALSQQIGAMVRWA